MTGVGLQEQAIFALRKPCTINKNSGDGIMMNKVWDY